jgi:hypothetical protein
MKLPGFLTPNIITTLRIAFLPVGAYALFKNGGDDPSWQIISWMEILQEVETPLPNSANFSIQSQIKR